MTMNRHICIHGHFYQPPRENPWLEAVEGQDSAYPYHDWNSRIAAECYGPNTASRILDADRRIIAIVNNYARMSFNMGPTLLSWMEKNEPDTYAAILAADSKSQSFFAGHGAAIAQAYNHMILPLARSRDKKTQIHWGISDFVHRFQRTPEGLWLPETAVDLETLDILAEYGIRFTLLAPRQARRVRRTGDEQWQDVNGETIDPQRPYCCRLPSGRTIAIFFYDGPISKDIAFNSLLDNGEQFARRLIEAFPPQQDMPRLLSIATDGETYGHHHRHGDMALCYCMYYIESTKLARMTVYGEYLEAHPPEYEVEIFDNSSWSCVHGLERWRGNCGCCSGLHPEWHQLWRAPLRGSMDWLRDNLEQIYNSLMPTLLRNHWHARDDYIRVILDRREETVRSFLEQHAARELTAAEKITALQLLEMQRYGMLMYTSCGWFFDEISGIENVQILSYAARAMQLAREASNISLEEAYVALLEKAPSNIPEIQHGAGAYLRFVQPAVLDLVRVGVHYAISSLFADYPETAMLSIYAITRHDCDLLDMGKQKLTVGRITVRSEITWDEVLISFAVLHLGDHNISGGVRPFISDEAFAAMAADVKGSFQRGDIAQTIQSIGEHFGNNSYSLWHLFRDEQRKIITRIFETAHREIEASFRQIHQHYYPFMQAVEGLSLPLPDYFSVVVQFIVNADLQALLESSELNFERLHRLADEAKKWNLHLDRPRLTLSVAEKISLLMQLLAHDPESAARMQNIIQMLSAAKNLSLKPDLWQAQNTYFSIGTALLGPMRQQAAGGDEAARHWVDCFQSLGRWLRVKVS